MKKIVTFSAMVLCSQIAIANPYADNAMDFTVSFGANSSILFDSLKDEGDVNNQKTVKNLLDVDYDSDSDSEEDEVVLKVTAQNNQKAEIEAEVAETQSATWASTIWGYVTAPFKAVSSWFSA